MRELWISAGGTDVHMQWWIWTGMIIGLYRIGKRRGYTKIPMKPMSIIQDCSWWSYCYGHGSVMDNNGGQWPLGRQMEDQPGDQHSLRTD